ncbi:MAG: PKD domain-containing protein [Methanosarcina flavescens]|jgi:beta propeller repeat protein|uniref:PKD domain-containing protein n=1 Tax=Methanosarcina flavescens TaxID=1715806 RepID=A0A660HP55_9EURY|nr:PKD domain-containing protein [Methanosarcina flavescens]AYK13826.1 PKD domain-containing protein [Methanosarcina flavescens]NLK31914.1 PKD domain-containing protein [Methanosarcina flavescens]
MKTNRGLYSLILSSTALVLFLILVSPTASANSPTVTETQITSSGSASCPVIWEDRILWEDGRNGGSDIYMYNLSTDTETRITTNGKAFDPRTCGNKIVWRDQRNLGLDGLLYGDIYMFDLSTYNETQITNGGLVWRSPAIYDDRIVYSKAEDMYMYDLDIYVYNLSTSTETRITTCGNAYYPAIYENKIVWADQRSGGSDIYMGTISCPTVVSYPPVAAFYACPISGKAPLKVKFKDKSTGSPSSWYWNFGDKCTSTAQNPTHKYNKAGKYTVSLTVENADGSDTKKICNYIKVR